MGAAVAALLLLALCCAPGELQLIETSHGKNQVQPDRSPDPLPAPALYRQALHHCAAQQRAPYSQHMPGYQLAEHAMRGGILCVKHHHLMPPTSYVPLPPP
jgi:hypothetical protein